MRKRGPPRDADDACGDAQKRAAMSFGLGRGDPVVEAERLGPWDQAHRAQHEQEPRVVREDAAVREVEQPHRLCVADPILDARMGAVAQFEGGDVAGRVRDEALVANALLGEEAELAPG